MPDVIQLLCLIVVVAACLIVVIRPGWRVLLTALLAFYFIQFVFLFYSTTTLFAAVNLIIGWMAAGVLGYSSHRAGLVDESHQLKAGATFRLLSEFFFILTGFALSRSASYWLTNIPFMAITAALILILTGILLLNYYHQSWQVISSLLVFLAGFELIYYLLESSLLVVMLLGLVKMAFAFTGSYVISLRRQDRSS